eukprot:9300439-Karenia_brevis.AAC.1
MLIHSISNAHPQHQQCSSSASAMLIHSISNAPCWHHFSKYASIKHSIRSHRHRKVLALRGIAVQALDFLLSLLAIS